MNMQINNNEISKRRKPRRITLSIADKCIAFFENEVEATHMISDRICTSSYLVPDPHFRALAVPRRSATTENIFMVFRKIKILKF